MKRKNLFLMFGLGAALMLTACSQDEVENNEGGMAAQSVAYFSSGSFAETTRTSMDYQGACYWTPGDYIFVKNGANYVPSRNAATNKVARENFYLVGEYTADTYPVLYTGNGKNLASQATSVEVKSNQSQSVADDGTHLGTDGDCGNAVATKTDLNSYTFNLVHRAAYLIITPRHSLTGNVVWKSVTVTTSGSDNLCGTYTFSENTTSLKDETVTNAGKSIALSVGNWTVPTVAEVENNYLKLDSVRAFMVIQPGTHTLTFTYKVEVDGTPRTFIKNVASREFLSGNFTNVKHILSDGKLNGGHIMIYPEYASEINDTPSKANYAFDFYKWGSDRLYRIAGTSYNHSVQAPNQLEITTPVDWTALPNVNELYHYAANGDPHWDGTSVTSIETFDNVIDVSGGLWVKKKQYIPEFSTEIGVDGADMRVTPSVFVSNAVKIGPPASSVINQYFFLPHAGHVNSGIWMTKESVYWSKSPAADPEYSHRAYALLISPTRLVLRYDDIRDYCHRNYGNIVAPAGTFK